jgi:hypothetical protein
VSREHSLVRQHLAGRGMGCAVKQNFARSSGGTELAGQSRRRTHPPHTIRAASLRHSTRNPKPEANDGGRSALLPPPILQSEDGLLQRQRTTHGLHGRIDLPATGWEQEHEPVTDRLPNDRAVSDGQISQSGEHVGQGPADALRRRRQSRDSFESGYEH